MCWARSTYGERRNAYSVLLRNSEGKRPLGRNRSTWEDNIKMDLQDVGWSLDWINLHAQYGQLYGSCEYCKDLPCFVKCGEYVD